MRKYTVDDLSYTVGENIRRTRVLKKITQEELHKRCGYKTNSYISKVERGDANPSLGLIVRIANALDVDAFDLLKKL